MTSKFIASAVLAVAALTSVAASAETFNPYLWDQMKTATTKTRAEVKAELLQAPKDGSATTAPSAYYGAGEPQRLRASAAGRAGVAPQANTVPVRAGAQ